MGNLRSNDDQEWKFFARNRNGLNNEFKMEAEGGDEKIEKECEERRIFNSILYLKDRPLLLVDVITANVN